MIYIILKKLQLINSNLLHVITQLCAASVRYLEKAIHVSLHVRDGHPLHDDVTDPPLQRLPFGPSYSGGVNACCSPVVGTATTENSSDVQAALTKSLFYCRDHIQ